MHTPAMTAHPDHQGPVRPTMSNSSDFFSTFTNASDEPFRWVFHGNIVIPTGNPLHAPTPEETSSTTTEKDVEWIGPGLMLCRCHVLCVDQDGIIEHISHQDNMNITVLKKRRNYVRLGTYEFLCPGFIDLHIHAPQFAYTGTATDRPLMGENGWLETYTFPAEKSLGDDLRKAKHVYRGVVQSTLATGTTTACYYGTLHLEPCKVLVEVCLQEGQRALVGKVCMDRNAPEDYLQDTAQNVKETRTLIKYIHKRAGKEEDSSRLPLVLPVVTPRFIPTCTPTLMKQLGQLAKDYRCHVQTHISESKDEVEFSKHLDFEKDGGGGRSDAEILDSHSLLTNRCILAHGVHCTPLELDLCRDRGAAIAHCPLSNFFFAGNALSTKRLMQRKVKVGLGTDVAGGYHPSMLESQRMCVIASKAVDQKAKKDNAPVNGKHALDYRHAFYLATLGAAEALGLEDCIGTFCLGMEFDAIILSANKVESPIRVFKETDTVQDVFQKVCTLGDDRNVKYVYVQGKQVKKPMERYEI